MAAKKRTARKGGKRTARKPAATPPSPDAKAAEEKFNRDLLIRGEAAPLAPDGTLPLDATHEIVESNDANPGASVLKRRRFKMW